MATLEKVTTAAGSCNFKIKLATWQPEKQQTKEQGIVNFQTPAWLHIPTLLYNKQNNDFNSNSCPLAVVTLLVIVCTKACRLYLYASSWVCFWTRLIKETNIFHEKASWYVLFPETLKSAFVTLLVFFISFKLNINFLDDWCVCGHILSCWNTGMYWKTRKCWNTR